MEIGGSTPVSSEVNRDRELTWHHKNESLYLLQRVKLIQISVGGDDDCYYASTATQRGNRANIVLRENTC